MKLNLILSFLLLSSVILLESIQAQSETPFPLLGEIKTLSASEINTSRWSIGGETLDRDYADYHAYKSYLGPLGAKRIRLQGGWAKCEQIKGQYDFGWLDAIVDDALEQGISPWLQTSYGNPIYEGGGDAALAGGIPTSEEALKAWDAWVLALVKHFKNRVNEWEIWNEPDLSDKFTASEYAAFYERTADIIRKEQPSSKIIALALCCMDWEAYSDTFLTHLNAVNKTDLVDIVTIHGYAFRPEDTYGRLDKLQKTFEQHGVDVAYWQGENGAPSTPKGEAVGALTDQDWSEITQAKWNLRRMLGDMGNGIAVTNVFQISEMHYGSGDHMSGLNSKGLLKTRPDKSVERPKLAYSAFQNTATVFSGDIVEIEDVQVEHDYADLAVYAYRKEGTEGSALTLWFSEAKPAEAYAEKKVTISLEQVNFSSPVMINLLTGEVYKIPETNFSNKSGVWTFKDIPVSDTPIVIANASWVSIEK